jgi:hypothetical protein
MNAAARHRLQIRSGSTMRIRADHPDGHWVIADDGQIVDASAPEIREAFEAVTGQERSPGPEIPPVVLDYSSTYRFERAAVAAHYSHGDIPAEGWTYTDGDGNPVEDTETFTDHGLPGRPGFPITWQEPEPEL